MSELTHFDEQGNAVMVDISDKDITSRTATATGKIKVSREIFERVQQGTIQKGDVLGVAELEVDLLTGQVEVIEFNSVVDCGTPINPNLARVQAEGGILQGIGMALSENVTYTKYGNIAENSFMQYKIPSRVDIGRINVEFESSYEGTGPFGAKSIGEVVINTPNPAIADAIYNATKHRFYELPITPEQIAMCNK